MKISSKRAGFTVVEVVLAGSILFLLVFGTMAAVQRESSNLSNLIDTSRATKTSHLLLGRIESELTYAQISSTTTTLTETLGSGDHTLSVASVAGLPNWGMLLIDPGMGSEERLLYSSFDAEDSTITASERGIHGTSGHAHNLGSTVHFAGHAESIENQVDPGGWEYDGVAAELSGSLFFRGDGYAISYRVPIAEPGEGFIKDGQVTWGASVAGSPLDTGYAALTFQAETILDEGELGQDLNDDDDTDDVFDLGRIRIRSWDGDNADADSTDVGISPNFILQEQNNWGGDLDGDGFDDPIFLWNAASQRLHVRLFIYRGGDNRRPVQPVESVIYLQNGVDYD